MNELASDQLRLEIASALLKHRGVLSYDEIAALPPREERQATERIVQFLLRSLPVRTSTRIRQTTTGWEWEEVVELDESSELKP